jgi:hypothetical protein
MTGSHSVALLDMLCECLQSGPTCGMNNQNAWRSIGRDIWITGLAIRYTVAAANRDREALGIAG